MEQSEMLWIASVAIGKKYSFETLKYSDYMYGNEDLIDEVWEFVEECEHIGIDAFKKKYNGIKLYF